MNFLAIVIFLVASATVAIIVKVLKLGGMPRAPKVRCDVGCGCGRGERHIELERISGAWRWVLQPKCQSCLIDDQERALRLESSR